MFDALYLGEIILVLPPVAKGFLCSGAIGIRNLPLVIWRIFGLILAASLLDPTMISNAWRERLTYAVMSAFVAWHTLALVVAPAPPSSVTAQGLRVLMQPYLSLLRLDNPWNFFAPPFGSLRMSQFRYVIEDKTGEKHNFMPESEFSGLSPSYFWFRGWYDEIIANPETYADIAAALYCRKHASLHPVSITLFEIQEKDFTQTDFLAGQHRWDPAFVTEKTIKQVTCPLE